jgi:acetyl esterase/lipase
VVEAPILVEDLQYRVIDGEPLLARLYRPSAGPAEAVLVDVHGGAWTMNDRLLNAPLHEHFARNGIAVFALDFRMPPKHRYPAAVHDVNFATRWLKANQARLGLEPRTIGGFGTSSGGHLAMLSALLPDDPRFLTPDPSLAGFDAQLDFVIACWPVLDPFARYRMAKERNIKLLVDAHQAFWPDEQSMIDGNPLRVVERGEATRRPAMLLLQGTADDNVEHEHTDVFAARYRRAGGDIDLHKYEGAQHSFIRREPAAAASVDALARIVRFVQSRSFMGIHKKAP